jgi:DNA-binding response OmpR family regulator
LNGVGIGIRTEIDLTGLAGAEVARVLLVSEQERWAERFQADLVAEGFRIVRDRAGESAFDEKLLVPVDIVVVDLRLRSQSGLAVCAGVRARSSIPILAVGDRTEESSVLAAYTAGADQFVSVDIASRLVVARLRALLRRVPPRSRAQVQPTEDLAVTIDESTGTVLVAGAVVKLSRRELEVLRTLLARAGRVVPRAELAGSWPALSADRRLDFVIRRLRQKLEAVDGLRRINAVRGVGFRFEEEGPVVGRAPQA